MKIINKCPYCNSVIEDNRTKYNHEDMTASYCSSCKRIAIYNSDFLMPSFHNITAGISDRYGNYKEGTLRFFKSFMEYKNSMDLLPMAGIIMLLDIWVIILNKLTTSSFLHIAVKISIGASLIVPVMTIIRVSKFLYTYRVVTKYMPSIEKKVLLHNLCKKCYDDNKVYDIEYLASLVALYESARQKCLKKD